MPILRLHAARFHERRIFSVTFTSAHLYGNVYMRVGVARALTTGPLALAATGHWRAAGQRPSALPIRPILGFSGVKFPKM